MIAIRRASRVPLPPSITCHQVSDSRTTGGGSQAVDRCRSRVLLKAFARCEYPPGGCVLSPPPIAVRALRAQIDHGKTVMDQRLAGDAPRVECGLIQPAQRCPTLQRAESVFSHAAAHPTFLGVTRSSFDTPTECIKPNTT